MGAIKTIRLYICELPERSVPDAALLDTLPESRRIKISSAASERVAASNLAAGLMLRDILSVREDDDIVFAERGKPYLKNGREFFSLSHDAHQTVLAVGDIEVGVDTEALREIKGSVKEMVFTEEERRYCGDDIRKSTRLWTRLEAGLKLTGEGIGGIKKREFPLTGEGDIRFATIERGRSFVSIACREDFNMDIKEYAFPECV